MKPQVRLLAPADLAALDGDAERAVELVLNDVRAAMS
jgi:hypothetical protein